MKKKKEGKEEEKKRVTRKPVDVGNFRISSEEQKAIDARQKASSSTKPVVAPTPTSAAAKTAVVTVQQTAAKKVVEKKEPLSRDDAFGAAMQAIASGGVKLKSSAARSATDAKVTEKLEQADKTQRSSRASTTSTTATAGGVTTRGQAGDTTITECGTFAESERLDIAGPTQTKLRNSILNSFRNKSLVSFKPDAVLARDSLTTLRAEKGKEKWVKWNYTPDLAQDLEGEMKKLGLITTDKDTTNAFREAVTEIQQIYELTIKDKNKTKKSAKDKEKKTKRCFYCLVLFLPRDKDNNN